MERIKILTEPAASCTWAAALRLKDRSNNRNNLVLIFCGGNLSLADLCKYVNHFQNKLPVKKKAFFLPAKQV